MEQKARVFGQIHVHEFHLWIGREGCISVITRQDNVMTIMQADTRYGKKLFKGDGDTGKNYCRNQQHW